MESEAEAAWSAELFPQYGSDGRIYEECGLLGNGPAIFAHVIFPTEEEYRILKKYDAISVHCPDSTSNVTAGIMPASVISGRGLTIALGTDVGGGHLMSVYSQVSRAIFISKLKEHYEKDYKRLLFPNAFWMATAGGGKAFGNVGKIEPGYKFNALVISGMQDLGYTLSARQCIERFCYVGDDRNISRRFIDGEELNADEVFARLMDL